MEKQNDNSEFENSKWSLYAEILTELRHKRDQIDMIKDTLGRLSDSKAITRTDINLINRVLSGELAMKLQRISVSDKYLEAMSRTRRKRKQNDRS
jgi:hypothetical protein|tara:strand:+ start:211 stop:495 length:285 start_codon:yes stop_codon:yes gene_type:complete